MKTIPPLLTLLLALFITGCMERGEKNTSSHQSNNRANHHYDAESFAIAEVDESIEGEEAEIVTEMDESDILPDIAAKKAELLEKYDLNGNGILDPEERAQLRDAKKEERIARFDTNGDGILDATEKSAMRSQIRSKVRKAKGKKHHGAFCNKLHDKALALAKDNLPERPSMQRLLARCEGIEPAGRLSYEDRRAKRCQKAKEKADALGEEAKNKPRLSRILAKCAACTSTEEGHDAGSLASLDLLETIENEDSEVVSEMDEGDIDYSISLRKKRFLNRFDRNQDGEISPSEACHLPGKKHKKKRLKKFDLNQDGQLDENEKSLMKAQIQKKMKGRFKGKKNKALFCQKMAERATALSDEEQDEDPMIQRVLARCEGIEASHGSYSDLKETRCEKAKSKAAELGAESRLNPRLKRILDKCGA